MNILFSAVLILVTICSSLVYSDTTNESSVNQNVINISIYSVKESTKLFNISAEYPQIDKVEPVFNEKIKSLVETKIADFKKASQENWKTISAAIKAESPPNKNSAEYPKRPFYFDIYWEPIQLNSKYISFVLHISFYEGGANGNEIVTTFNYDFSNNQEITLYDLLCDYPDYLKTISDYAIKELESSIKTEGNADILKKMINEGAGPKEENFENFTFTGKMINIYFSKAKVLPGYFGEQEVHIPRSVFIGKGK